MADALTALREPFPASQVGKLPKGGVTLDYVGHGAVTHRLLDVDAEWSWEPMALDASGLPLFTCDAQGNPIAFWIRLTVAGVTRLGCGTCRSGQFDAEKVLIGDAIRNAAMRFGVALDLWVRGHAEDDEKHTTSDSRSGPARDVPVPGFRSSLMAAKDKLTEAERGLLREWLKDEGLPDRPSEMNAEQASRTAEWILHGLPKVDHD